jgi:arylsulfatase A-like enzyme
MNHVPGTLETVSEATDRREFLKTLGLGAGAIALWRFLPSGVLSAASRPPNFIVIFTDDQGYQDVGCFGSPDIATPNLDRMAAEGVRFTDFYTAAPVCSPARAAILTGCYPPRVGVTKVLFPNSRVGLNPDEITIADLLRTRGYATACVGKWHLGHLPEFLPTRQGFDSYFGIPYSNDMKPTPLMRDTSVVEEPARQETLTRRYTEEAVRFIAANRKRPFFVYLAHTFPHVPLHAAAAFKGKSRRGRYGDTIEEIDWGVGELIRCLKKLGLDRDTLIVFTSDNGPWLGKGKNGGSALPLRGGKFSTWEGGMRMPTIMRWPGTMPAGKTCREVAATIDLLPTFAALARARLPTDRVIDGRNILPLIQKPERAKSPHQGFYYYKGGNLQAVRSGTWKLRKEGRAPALYDLARDIGEEKDVSAQNPAVARQLQAMMSQFNKSLKARSRPIGKSGSSR